jgi:nucleoside-diphosphate-sugar epimerase
LILISSVSVYGPYTLGLYDENTPCRPVGPYPLSKFHAELRAIEIADKSGMALTILRLATLYGEGDPGNVGRLIRSLDQGRFVWIGDGSNRKSLLYKRDAARACVAVASSPAAGTCPDFQTGGWLVFTRRLRNGWLRIFMTANCLTARLILRFKLR